MINIRANWLRFGAFLSPPAPPFGLTDDWPLPSRSTLCAPRPTPHAPRPTPHAPRSPLMPGTNRRIPHELQSPLLYFRALSSATASSRAGGEPGTGAAVVKDRTGPDLEERSIHIQYITETGNSSDK